MPLSITAFSADALHEQGILNIKGITERTPGLTMGQFNPGQPQIYIRGLGTNVRGAAEDPGVIVFVDEVYIGRARAPTSTCSTWNASRCCAALRARCSGGTSSAVPSA